MSRGEIMSENEYVYIRKLFYQSIFQVKNVEENIQMIFYSVLAFFIPFILGHPQWAVGIIVNAALILGATYLRGYKLLPVILLPSLGVLTAGVIFGSFTWFLVYLVPFIWVGNALYVYAHKHFMFKKWNSFASIGLSSVIKSAFLFTSAFLLYTLGVIPAIFLTAMGILQIVTAIIGGVVAIGIVTARNKLKN